MAFFGSGVVVVHRLGDGAVVTVQVACGVLIVALSGGNGSLGLGVGSLGVLGGLGGVAGSQVGHHEVVVHLARSLQLAAFSNDARAAFMSPCSAWAIPRLLYTRASL